MNSEIKSHRSKVFGGGFAGFYTLSSRNPSAPPSQHIDVFTNLEAP